MSDVLPVEAAGGQEWYYMRSAWHLQSDVRSAWHLQSDIPRSDVPPNRSIWWPRVVLLQVSLTFTVRCKSAWHLQSGMPRSAVPPSRGIWWPRVVLHQVSLTFTVKCKVSLTFPVRHAQVRCTPLVEASSGQDWYKSMMGSNGFSSSFHVQLLER